MNQRTLFRSLAVVGRCGLCLAGTWIALLSFAGAATAQLSDKDFPVLAADVAVGDGSMTRCLEQLEGVIECGRFRVPEDRSKSAVSSGGRILELAFVLARATETENRTNDAITFNDATTLTGNVLLNSGTGGGNIDFRSTLTGTNANPDDVIRIGTVDPITGAYTFLYNIPSLAAYEAYKARLRRHPIGQKAFAFAQQERFIRREDRTFLKLVSLPHGAGDAA